MNNKKALTPVQLMWNSFKKHKLAMLGLIIMIFMYFIALTANFISPHAPNDRARNYTSMSPQKIHLIGENGSLRPFIYGVKEERDPHTLEKVYTINENVTHQIYFFVRSHDYKFMGLFNTNLHLFQTETEKVPLFPFGTDQLGRCIFSRTLYGTRISLSIGLIGVFMSLIIGLITGGLSGYYGGFLDLIIQRVIEFVISIPKIPLWMALAAALPDHWSIIQLYLAITVILSLVGWTILARVIRGKVISLREEEFCDAAKGYSSSDFRIIYRHLLPNCFSYILVNLTLAIPNMIIGETALSFLGIGLRPPAISWGVLLQDAQQLNAIVSYPWRFIPAVFVIISVLGFNFIGDGLRDAVDPYSH